MGLSLHVLLVEDSEDDALLLVRALRRSGYDPDFRRVETAVELGAALQEQAWDLILSDHNLPSFNAQGALTLLRETGLDLPFIIVSGKIGEEMAVALMKAGAHDYIKKNNLARLIPAIERELKEAEVRRGRRKAEEASRRSEEKYRTLVENANDAILIVQDEVIKFANGRTREVLGYSEEELARIPFVEHIHPDDRGAVYERHQKWLQGENPPLPYSFRVRNKSGEVLWAELNGVMIEWEGRPATLNFVRDITEHKELEEQFLQAQKMEAVGQLAGGFAHDFNNSLTLIKVCSELALLELKEGDPLREKIEMIHEATDRSAKLANQLLAFSRRQIMEMKVLDLNSLLRELEKMLCRVIGAEVALTFQLGEDLGRVKADPAQVEQMILNLALNARDAMPKGGWLVVETSNAVLDQEYTRIHPEVAAGQYVMLSASDTGVGMTPEVRERIFEPFFTTKEKGRGTGLGLSTVYGIVRQSGGSISVTSEPGRGTTFRIYLPRVEYPLDGEKKRLWADELPQGGETILVAEDEGEVRILTVEVLKRQGYKVLEAADVEEALRVYEKGGGLIHLLLTDMVMPQMDGRELAKRLRPRHPEMKILYMTGYLDYPLLPGERIIMKPFSLEGLTRKVREVLDQEIR